MQIDPAAVLAVISQQAQQIAAQQAEIQQLHAALAEQGTVRSDPPAGLARSTP